MKIVDCGDVPVSPMDNALAIDQMEVAYSSLLARSTDPAEVGFTLTKSHSKDGLAHPRVITFGGDHTIVLPILRSLHKVYGPISIIHFDAHIDTWLASPQTRISHATFFYIAYEEGLLSNTSIHVGIRCKFSGIADLENDSNVGFKLISTDDVDDLGPVQVIKLIRDRIGDNPVYFSFDIDVIDPSMAPATGTPEPGGLTTREVKRIIRGLAGLNFVGADIVEVAPAYDNADVTAIAAANIAQDLLMMLLTPGPAQNVPNMNYNLSV